MKKRKLGAGGNIDGMGTSIGGPGMPSGSNDINYGVVPVSPSARESHSCEVSGDGALIVFGGDRHQMPFNDLYLMQLVE